MGQLSSITTVVKSIQYGSVSISSGTPTPANIAAVNTAKSVIHSQGFGNAAAGMTGLYFVSSTSVSLDSYSPVTGSHRFCVVEYW